MITQPYYHLLRASGPEGTVQIPNGRPKTKVINPKPAIKQGTTASHPTTHSKYTLSLVSLNRWVGFPEAKRPLKILFMTSAVSSGR